MDEVKTNLLGWHPNGEGETKKLLRLLIVDAKFKTFKREKKVAYLWGGFEQQYRLFSFTDNGGEINVEPVNLPGEMRSIASTWRGTTPLNAETMYYRIMCHLKGEEIDWNEWAPSFSEDDWRALLGSNCVQPISS